MTLILTVKVVPSSRVNKYILDKSNILKIYVKSRPEQGKANHELIQILSRELNIPKADIEIVAGHTSQNKRLKIATSLSVPHIWEQLGIQKQMTLFVVSQSNPFNKKD